MNDLEATRIDEVKSLENVQALQDIIEKETRLKVRRAACSTYAERISDEEDPVYVNFLIKQIQRDNDFILELLQSVCKPLGTNLKPILSAILRKPQAVSSLRHSVDPQVELFLLEHLDKFVKGWAIHDLKSVLEEIGTEQSIVAIETYIKGLDRYGKWYKADLEQLLAAVYQNYAKVVAKRNKLNDVRSNFMQQWTQGKPVDHLLEFDQTTFTQAQKLFLNYKPTRAFKSRLNEQLDTLKLAYTKDLEAADLILVNKQVSVEYMNALANILASGKPVITEDQMKAHLLDLEDPWLRNDENEHAQENIIQLLVSNTEENILIALQMVAGSGGASEVIMSMLAALMMASPSKKVTRESEKLFKKFGSNFSYNNLKGSKVYLRRSGNTQKKMTALFKQDTGVLEMPFRIMHSAIVNDNQQIADAPYNSFQILKGEIKEPIPSFIDKCHHIENVSFSASKFTITVHKVLAPLSKIDQIKRLDFSKCKVEIPSQIGDFRNLEELDLSQCSLEDPAILERLTALRVLKLNGTKIKDWSFLSSMSNLRHLELERNKMNTVPEEVYELENLKHVSLRHNQIKAVEADRFKSPIEHVDLGYNKIEAADDICNIKGLTHLYLSKNNISSLSSISNASLLKLDLSNNELSELDLIHSDLEHLYELDLSKNKFTELHETWFKVPRLRILKAAHNEIQEIPKAVKDGVLYELDLQSNRISELKGFLAHTRLKLNVASNQINKVDPNLTFETVGYWWNLGGNPIPYLP
ncbi:MAG: hypothetical protein MRY83_03120 [Flavobacteriales bacterium]|nr:hypothetical protein [Flavobacteriales bacterium]